MAKKNRKKRQSIYKAIRPIIKDNRVLYSVLGALSAGLGLGLALGTDKGEALINKLTTVVKDLSQHKTVASKKPKPDKPAKSAKLNKLARLPAL